MREETIFRGFSGTGLVLALFWRIQSTCRLQEGIYHLDLWLDLLDVGSCSVELAEIVILLLLLFLLFVSMHVQVTIHKKRDVIVV